MLYMMDKDEIIILSSDDDDESNDRQFEKYKPYVTIKQISKKPDKNLRISVFDRNSQNAIKRKFSTIQNNNDENKTIVSSKVPKIKCRNLSKKSPEVVDLVDCLEKSPKEFTSVQSDCRKNGEAEQVQSHFKLDVIDVDAGEDDPKCSLDQSLINTSIGEANTQESQESLTVRVESNQENVTNEVESNMIKSEENGVKAAVKEPENPIVNDVANEGSDQNLKCFTEFVEFCGSLEVIPNDRVRLTKKLMKRYGEADSYYIKSEEFRLLIQKCKEKVNKNNLYLIAKDITAELSFRKKISITAVKSSPSDENSERNCENTKKIDPVLEEKHKETKKRTKFINKILKKLDKLGSKIRELEEKEVDLSDEEESAYVQLQRYRDRFCLIYKKLCKYTNEIPDADRVYNRKICFTESKYPAINKCIEVFLNKTKSFPDFTDIIKLLESQSSSLRLPSNRESLRMIAIEIFQQVGVMLQRRRMYDLWDSFCGFLNDEVDPANDDPVLDKILKDNYDSRIKKEQDIFQHYSELQEKERLEPEEVPEEEANISPEESGNEDEQEIEEIENDINKRLDEAITEDTKDDGNRANDSEESKTESRNETSTTQRESKNNYKNCKSLKWRSENPKKSKSESGNSEDSSTDLENDEREVQKPLSVDKEDSADSKESDVKSEKAGRNDSETELFAADTVGEVGFEKTVGGGTKTVKENLFYKSKFKTNGSDYFDIKENENCIGKSNDSFDVHYCHVFADNIFENFSEKKKYGKKRKVFRDLTNVNRLMELHGKSNAMSGLFSPSFFHRSFRDFEKSSWKKRFRICFPLGNFREQKCALGQDEKTGKNMNSSNTGRESNERNGQNNSEGCGDEKEGFYSGQGGESHEDGDEDRNRKNGRTGDDLSGNKLEEEDDEEEKDENETESNEHSQQNEKTEELKKIQPKAELPSDILNTGTKTDLHLIKDNHRKHNEHKYKEKTEERITEEKEESSCIEEKGKTKTVENIEENREGIEVIERNEEIEIAEKAKRRVNGRKKRKVAEKKEREAADNNEKKEKEVAGNDEKKRRKVTEKKEGEIADKKESEITKKEKNDNTEKVEGNEILKEEKTDISEKIEDTKCLEKDSNEIVEKSTEKTTKRNDKESICNKSEIEESENQERVKYALEINDSESMTEKESQPIAKKKNAKKRVVRMVVNDELNIIGPVVPKYPSKRLSQETSTKKVEIPLNKTSKKAENQFKGCIKKKENYKSNVKAAQDIVRAGTTRKSFQVEHTSPKVPKKNAASTSDEEIVKRFLMHSPSSISITPPRKLSLSKPPSQAAMKALATLRNLKGISATIVRGKPKNQDDITVIGGSNSRSTNQDNSSSLSKRVKSKLPVISNVQSIYHATPKIVTVQGNVSGFENCSQDKPECNSSSIKISNVWGNLPNNFMQSIAEDHDVTPGCSSYNYQQNSYNFQQSSYDIQQSGYNYQPWQGVKKKSTKKKVEYVVLD